MRGDRQLRHHAQSFLIVKGGSQRSTRFGEEREPFFFTLMEPIEFSRIQGDCAQAGKSGCVLGFMRAERMRLPPIKCDRGELIILQGEWDCQQAANALLRVDSLKSPEQGIAAHIFDGVQAIESVLIFRRKLCPVAGG